MSHGHPLHPSNWPMAAPAAHQWPQPYPGPPPVPPGMNPQQWAAGYWQVNPAFNAQQFSLGMQAPGGLPQGVSHWAPGQGWVGQAGVPAAQHNPYKRVPRPPDPSYWASELSDNPLGLENMVPRGERRAEGSGDDDDTPQTPWIWNPPGLVTRESEEDPYADRRQRQPSRRSTGEDPSPGDGRRKSSGRLSQEPRETSSVGAEPVPHQDPNLPPLGRPTDTSSMYYVRRHPEGIPPDVSPPERSRASHSQHNSDTRNGSGTSDHHRHHHSHHHSSSGTRRSHLHDDLAGLPESFTSRMDLRPTFSPDIVRTPNHYQSPSRRGSEDEMASRRSPSGLSPNRPSPTEPEGHILPSSGLYSDGPPVLGRPREIFHRDAAYISRHSSLPVPASSSSGIDTLSSFVEEPSSVLSPLIGATPRPSSGSRPMLRSQTEPTMAVNGLSTIHETATQNHTSRDRLKRPSPKPSPPSHTSSPTSHGRSPSSHHEQPPSNRDRLSGPYRNPLPPPPADVHNPATSAPFPSRPPPPSGTWSRRIRRGFWNRRGDFLTRNNYIVYAPDHLSFPEELRDYPEKDYRDEMGVIAPYIEDRPELPESLPRRGHAPVQPYEIFVTYEYIP